MFLDNLLKTLPQSTTELIIYVVAILGIILLAYGIFLETEKRQDIVFMLSSGSLLVYAIFIGNLIFTIAMAVMFLAALTEFIEILFGIHKPNKYHLKQLIREGKKILKN